MICEPFRDISWQMTNGRFWESWMADCLYSFFFRESLIWKYLGFHYQYPLAIACWNFDYDFRVNINTLINNSVLHIQRTPHLQGEDGNVRVQGGNMLKCCLSIGEPEIACYIWILNKVT